MAKRKDEHIVFLQQIEPDRWLVNGIPVEVEGTTHLANILLYIMDYDLPFMPQVFECLCVNTESDIESKSDTLEAVLEDIPVSDEYVCRLIILPDNEVDYQLYKLQYADE